MERTTRHRSPGSNARALDEPPIDPQHPPNTSAPSTDFSADDSIPLFLSDSQGQPVAAGDRASILKRVGGLVVAAFAILVAVFNPDVTRALIDKATSFMGGATSDQSATQAAREDPARASDPVTPASGNAAAPRSAPPGRAEIASAYHSALQSEAPAARAGNEAAARSKTLDAETLAALVTRAKSLLALGDIAPARLLLERAANAQDATAAFLLAQTYDPAVLGVRDTRSIAPEPVLALDWYRKAASLGSADAQRRLTQLQN